MDPTDQTPSAEPLIFDIEDAQDPSDGGTNSECDCDCVEED